MAESFGNRLRRGWNAFTNADNSQLQFQDLGAAYSVRPDRTRLNFSNERTIIASIYTQVGIDVAAVNVRHVRLDDNQRFLEYIEDGLDACLTLSANIDQTGRAFRQDAVMTLCEEGCIAIVPVDTTINPSKSGSYDIRSLRVGLITQWYPKHVKVSIYNERAGRRDEVILPKHTVAIVENPLYSVMNEPNSTLKRLAHKLNLLDSVDEQTSAGKLDLIIQLPYVVKSEARRQQAETRRKDIEVQLQGSEYGIAYTDGTEKITQLNRPVTNNLLDQVTYLTKMLYSQLGITEEVFNGTADEKTMLNYYNRTIEPILSAITDSMRRSFLTATARAQRQSVEFFRDPFRLVPVSDMADIADKFTRNEILSSNEIRAVIGYRPVDEQGADELRNKNLNAAPAEDPYADAGQESEDDTAEIQNPDGTTTVFE